MVQVQALAPVASALVDGVVVVAAVAGAGGIGSGAACAGAGAAALRMGNISHFAEAGLLCP